jgi:hypothetical protein
MSKGQEKMAKILTDHTAREALPRGIPWLWNRMFRRIAIEMELTPTRFNELCAIYREPGLSRRQERDALRRLINKLSVGILPFRDFWRALRLIRASAITISIRVEFHDAPMVEVAHHITMGPEPKPAESSTVH